MEVKYIAKIVHTFKFKRYSQDVNYSKLKFLPLCVPVLCYLLFVGVMRMEGTSSDLHRTETRSMLFLDIFLGQAVE